jgi:hypothetical protein
MGQQEPPRWETDSLSKYFSDAEYNERVTAINYRDVYSLLQSVQVAFERAEAAVEKGAGPARPLPQILIVRAHSAFLAAIRLGMSGLCTEAQVVLRSGIESAWYALHIAADPAPGTRAEVWLRRNESDEATARCRTEFKVGRIRATHEAIDAAGASDMHWLYQTVIDFGAHPNQQGVLAAVIRSETESQRDYRIGILQPDEPRVMMSLRLAVSVAVAVLRIFGKIYPERFALVGLDTQIDQLVAALNAMFKRFVRHGTA